MRTFLPGLLVLALLGAAPALAQTVSKTYLVETFTQNLTGTAPTAADDGVSLEKAEGWAVTVSAPSGQTISGGSLLCYYLAAVSSTGNLGASVTRRWTRCKSDLDVTPSTGTRDPPSLNFRSYVGAGRIKYVPSSITLSGAGTTVDVTIEVRRAP
jgi:hypothetical protein